MTVTADPPLSGTWIRYGTPRTAGLSMSGPAAA